MEEDELSNDSEPPELFRYEDSPEAQQLEDVIPPYIQPTVGDRIEFYDGTVDRWLDVVVLKTPAQSLKKYPGYYNIQYSDGKKGSVQLQQDSLWRFADTNRQQFFLWKWGHLFVEGADKSPEGTRDDG